MDIANAFFIFREFRKRELLAGMGDNVHNDILNWTYSSNVRRAYKTLIENGVTWEDLGLERNSFALTETKRREIQDEVRKNEPQIIAGAKRIYWAFTGLPWPDLHKFVGDLSYA
jgi:hypothetical protein